MLWNYTRYSSSLYLLINAKLYLLRNRVLGNEKCHLQKKIKKNYLTK